MSNRSTLLLEHHLKELRLPTFLREYRKLAAQCAAENVDHPDYLLRLAELELIDRHQRMVERRIRAARFPAVKSLDTFDFLAIPSVNKALVMELARCEYVEHQENVIAVGNSGTGKTHVALGLGLGPDLDLPGPQVPHRVDRVHPAAADPVDGHYHQGIAGGQLGVESPPAGAAVGPGAS